MVTCLISILRALYINVVFASQRPVEWLAGEVPALDLGFAPVGRWTLNGSNYTMVTVVVERIACADNLLRPYAWRSLVRSIRRREGAVYYELDYTCTYQILGGPQCVVMYHHLGTHNREMALWPEDDSIHQLVDADLI